MDGTLQWSLSENLAFDRHVEANFTVIGKDSVLPKAVDGKLDSCFVEVGHRNLPLAVHITDQSLVDVVNVLLWKDFAQSGNEFPACESPP